MYDYGDQPSSSIIHQTIPEHPSDDFQRPNTNPRSRPLSFLPSAREEISHSLREGQEDARKPSKPLSRAKTLEGGMRNFERPSHHANRQYVVSRSISAPHDPHLRSPADTATSSFPLNDIDYESSPAAVAQELSNLQAIRRMSMNVDATGDPDLPSFGVSMPSPSAESDSEESQRLFWVPASLHPELAPKEFKSFIDTRVESLKRRSGEFNVPNDQPTRSGSGGSGGLRRKKSMLSRQIDNSDGKAAERYQDGAERLDRKRSSSSKELLNNSGVNNLHDMEALMDESSRGVSNLTLDTQQEAQQPIDEDKPIIPLGPGGNSLKRSTRTTYRRTSLRDGKRVPPSRRKKTLEADNEEALETSPVSATEPPAMGVNRVQTEPVPSIDRQLQEKPAENFSRPSSARRPSPISPPGTGAVPFDQPSDQTPRSPPDLITRKSPPPPDGQALKAVSPPGVPTSREPKPFVSQIASNGRTTARIPPIYEGQPAPEPQRAQVQPDYRPPERVSSHQPISLSQQQPQPQQLQPQAPLQPQPQPQSQPSASSPSSSTMRSGSGKRPAGARGGQQTEQSGQNLQHMAAHPAPLPGNSTRTDNLTFIPTLTEDKRAESRKETGKKSGWGAIGSWLGGDERERERRKEEEARERDAAKKNKMKMGKASDSGRLDVLQTTMESTQGRESLVLERGDVRLEEERRKESSKRYQDTKKEKDGLFTKMTGFFGDSKKRPEREVSGKKSGRTFSPGPPRPALKPDVDYNWTRFSIIEERAIYRMAHIKLANPRRPLYSQVLLSNFMYSYLAKVQQMHPQIQIPQTAAAKAQQRVQQQAQQQQQQQQQQKKAEQPEEYYQYQRYQEQLQEQDRAAQAQSMSGQEHHEEDSYMEDNQYYAYEGEAEGHDDSSRHDGQYGMMNGDGAYGQAYGYNYQAQEHSAYQYQQAQFNEPHRGEREHNDMW